MKKTAFIPFFAGAAAGAAGVVLAKKQIETYFSDEKNKRKWMDKGDALACGVLKKLADAVSDNGIPDPADYQSDGLLCGNDVFLRKNADNARWSVGFSKASIFPEKIQGDLYVGGYLVFPPNKADGFLTDQLIRVMALDDGSGRGIHVFAVIDCVGISNTDVRIIRKRLQECIKENNILSLNISATHCHSGVDTMGLWGDLVQAVKVNPRAVRKGTPEKIVNGKNPAFMEQLFRSAVKATKEALENMKQGTLAFALLDGTYFSRDKRPPMVKDNILTALRFVPDDGTKPLYAVFFAAHPVCYGSDQKQISSDFPYFMCEEFEKQGFDGMFFQGAQAAIATERGPHIPKGISRNEGIAEYGRAIARFVLGAAENEYKNIDPILNVIVREFRLPCDNPILELAGKVRIINNNLIRVTENGKHAYHIMTEIGYAELGNELKLVMIPGEMMPELLVGGAFSAKDSYNGTEWSYPSMRDITDGHLAVVGLCNDHIGYIVPDNDFGSIFAPLHYEESVSLGSRCASGIMQAYMNLLQTADHLHRKT